MYEKPKKFAAIGFALVGLFAFFICNMVSHALLKSIIDFMWDLPLLGNVVKMIIPTQGDTLALILSILSPIIAYFGTLFTLVLINKHEPTFRLSCEITGVVIMSIHIVYAVINIISGESILTNMTQLLAGYLLFTSRK